jgi:hypothetical protein
MYLWWYVIHDNLIIYVKYGTLGGEIIDPPLLNDGMVVDAGCEPRRYSKVCHPSSEILVPLLDDVMVVDFVCEPGRSRIRKSICHVHQFPISKQ